MSSELISITPTQRMDTMTATATRIVKPYSVSRARIPRLRASGELMLVTISGLKSTIQAISANASVIASAARSACVMESTSPTSTEEYLANAPPRESTTRPSAMDVDENTLMIVSALILELCLTQVMSTAQRTPKMSMAAIWFSQPSTTPMAMPVSALWPSASEKNAILLSTAIVPSKPNSGVMSSMASSAFFMNV